MNYPSLYLATGLTPGSGELHEDLVIIKLDHANQTLANANTLQQTTQILDVACAAEIYAKRHKLGKVAIQYAGGIKLEALRRLGELLKAMPKAKGGQPFQKQSTGSKSEPVATLADLGIDKKTSMVAQKLADLPQSLFEQVRDGTITLTKALQAKDGKTNKPAWSLESFDQALLNAINRAIEDAPPGSHPRIAELLRRRAAELDDADRPELRDAVSIARDDLSIRDAEPGGFKIFEDEQGAATHPGAPHVIGGCKSTYPLWYRNLTTAEDGVTPLKRTQVEARLDDIDKGKLPTKRTAQTYWSVMWAIKDLARTSSLGRGAS